jgi:hypothetical protein
MKNKLAICAGIALAAITAQPIAAQAQKPMLGAKLGLNLDQTSGDALDSKFNAYFLGGVYAGLRFEKISLHAEGYFTQTTMTTGTNFGNAFSNYIKGSVADAQNGDFKLSELSIPVLVGFKVAPRLWLQAGPQFTAVVNINDKDDILKETESVFKSGYISGVVGAWVDLPFRLNASARYVFGLSNRNNASEVPETWRTSHIQLAVGLRIL